MRSAFDASLRPFCLGWRRCPGGRRLLRIGYTAFALAVLGCGGDPEDGPLGPQAPLGSATVRWSLTDDAGADVNCADVRISGFEVALGSMPQRIDCGANQEATFTELLPGRFPVVIRLLTAGDAELQVHIDNLIVRPRETAEYSHTFVVGGSNLGTGTLDIRWFIDGAIPAQGCPASMGRTVRLRLTNGPQSDLQRELPCLSERLELPGIRQGTYTLRIDLLDSAGARIGFPAEDRNVRVNQNTTELARINVVTILPERGSLLALWTVNSSQAVDGCAVAPPDNAVRVTVRNDEPRAAEIATATAACSAGGVSISNLPGRTPEGVGLQAEFELLDLSFSGLPPLDRKIVGDISVQPPQTSTVSVDFELQSSN